MKFDFIIGNPPYQESQETSRDKPVYNFYMDEAYSLADVTILITPGKFLFDGGATPKAWNKKMLNDEHLKLLEYYPDAKEVFQNVSFTGGVAITYYDLNRKFRPIEFYSVFPQVNSISSKVRTQFTNSFSEIMYGQGSYKFTAEMHAEHPEIKYHENENGENIGILSKGHDNDIATSALEKLDGIILFETMPNDGHEYIEMTGRKNGERATSYIRRDYVCSHENLEKYKVIISNADGAAGILGNPVPARITGKPVVINPGVAHTQTFIGIGCFNSYKEAENAGKYIKTKFCRMLLGVLKVTQHNPPDKWSRVPLQDFSDASDIDWSKGISEIDSQLFQKYGLTKEEIDFIETHIKEME